MNVRSRRSCNAHSTYAPTSSRTVYIDIARINMSQDNLIALFEAGIVAGR